MAKIDMELQALQDAIRLEFIPALTGQNHLSDELCNLLALLARTGSLGLNNPVREAVIQFHTSVKVTAPLVKLVLQQSRVYTTEAMAELSEIKSQIRQEKQSELASTEVAELESLPNPLKKAKGLASEMGPSSWLTALPITDHGFRLHKGAFHNTVCLRYNWTPPLLPSSCVCSSSFQVDHTLSCHYGGFPFIRHNELRDLTAHLFTEVCSNVGVEPALQPLWGVSMDRRTANSDNNTRLDIKADNFWNRKKVHSLT